MHPVYENRDDRAALFGLLDRTWPGIARKLEVAARLGWRWDEVTTPFVSRERGTIVSHVGVLELPVRLGGRDLRIGGLHAVCTDPAHRRRGHYRRAMDEALSFVDARWRIVKLHTHQPELYQPFGFRLVPQHRFRLERRGGPGRGRSVSEADLPAVHDLLRRRMPVSEVFAARDEGWLFGIDEVIATGGLDRLVIVEERQVDQLRPGEPRTEEPKMLVVCEVVSGVLRVHDVVAAVLPTLDEVLAAAPAAFEAVELWMPADLLAPGAAVLPYPPSDLLMVRGDWPDLPPFAVGELASH